MESEKAVFMSSSSCILSGPDIDCLMSNFSSCLSVICVMDKSNWGFTAQLQICQGWHQGRARGL